MSNSGNSRQKLSVTGKQWLAYENHHTLKYGNNQKLALSDFKIYLIWITNESTF